MAARFNKYGVDVSSLVDNGYSGNLDAFRDQSAIDNLSVSGYTTGGITPTKVPTLTGNTMIDYANSDGLGGLTQGTWNNLGQAAGLAGTTYGLYDSLLGNKADLFKEQMGMLKDQRASNAETMANRRKFKENIGGGFSNAFGGGLAASTARVG